MKKTQVPTFSDLYQHAVANRGWLGPFLSGHLMVEFMLRKLISQHDKRLTVLSEKMRHAELIDLAAQLGHISPPQKDVLLAINRMRNRLAHQITYIPTLDELRSLWESARAAFTDLTDGIGQGISEMDIEGRIDHLDAWVFSEFFIQISYDLHQCFIDLGGDDESFT